MKRNAVLIAGIMFVAGCASNGRYSTANSAADTSDVALGRSTEMVARTPTGEFIPPSDPSLSAQYDPATGSYGTYASGSDSSAHRNLTSVNDYHADSSVQGGSNEARGWDRRRDLPTEGTPHPINPAVQADSSIRGGSMQARQSDWYSNGPFEPSVRRSNRIKADSSIRGGSNQARYPQYQSSNTPDSGDAMDQGDNQIEYVIVVPEESDAVATSEVPDTATSVLGSSNWNPGDDMLRDGTLTQPSAVNSSQSNSDASVGGAASSETGSSSSSALRDDIHSHQNDVPASGRETSDSGSLSSPGSKKDLNSSANLEKDISGSYNLNRRADAGVSDITSSQKSANVSVSPSGTSSSVSSGQASAVSGSTDVQNSATSTAVGGPGSTETGAASSSGSYDSSTPVLPADPSRDSYSLFHNNRAQGVGSAATGEHGIANGASVDVADDQLASQVKSILMKETTGTADITQRDVAKNVQVISHNGDVTLKGRVPSQKAKDVLEIRAREISGVHRVHNQLTISPADQSATREFEHSRDLEDTSSEAHSLDQPRE